MFSFFLKETIESDNEPVQSPHLWSSVKCDFMFCFSHCPLDVDNRLGGHGSVGESHIRPLEVDIQDTATLFRWRWALSGQGQ